MTTVAPSPPSSPAQAGQGASAPASSIPPLKRLTLAHIAAGLDAGTFTAVQLVQAHLDQIARFDGWVHAVLQLNPRALEVARELDVELLQTGRRGPLHGVPILVKDNVVTHEPGLEATAGSLALLGAKPARENPAVSRLRAAGAVILGTANCSEWANFRSRPSDSGWSGRGGQTVGAYHAQQDPSGSSSGSGVAVDMGFCVLAIGTETSGSIISPATQNNVVGLKPTTGLVSRDAVIPISPEQDTAGPMARTVADAAAMLSVMAGRDIEHDPKTAEIPFDTLPDYFSAAQPLERLPPMRLGIPRDAMEGVKQDILDAFESRVVAPLQSQHKITIVDCSFPGLTRYNNLSPDERTNYMAGEFHDALPAYLAQLTSNPQNVSSLEELCSFLKTCPEEEYGEATDQTETKGQVQDGETETKNSQGARPALRNIKIIEQAIGIPRDSPAFAAAKANAAYFSGPGGILGALEGSRLGPERPHGFNTHEPVDALLLPTSAGVANYFAACEGHPQITIPLGYRCVDAEVKHNGTGRLVSTGPNVPYGVSVIGRKYSEATTLLPLSAAIEALTHARDEVDERHLADLRG